MRSMELKGRKGFVSSPREVVYRPCCRQSSYPLLFFFLQAGLILRFSCILSHSSKNALNDFTCFIIHFLNTSASLNSQTCPNSETSATWPHLLLLPSAAPWPLTSSPATNVSASRRNRLLALATSAGSPPACVPDLDDLTATLVRLAGTAATTSSRDPDVLTL